MFPVSILTKLLESALTVTEPGVIVDAVSLFRFLTRITFVIVDTALAPGKSATKAPPLIEMVPLFDDDDLPVLSKTIVPSSSLDE